mgnify:CR=1 FL=1
MGGHWAHIGGALFGIGYVYTLRKGTDLTEGFQNWPWKKKSGGRKKTSRKNFVVVHKTSPAESKPNRKSDTQSELDRILDKINAKGYENLSPEEKEFLYQASKKK